MKQAIKIAGNYKLLSTITSFNGIGNIKYATPEQLTAWGVKNVVEPTITKHQYLGKLILDAANNVVTYQVLETNYTAQELHIALLKEGETVFEEYRKMLETSTIVKRILGTHSAEIIALVNKLEAVKVGIIGALDLYVSTNNLEKLKNFSYNTPEAAALTQEILNFK